MPTYEYMREDGSRFEVIQKFSDTPLTICPETGQQVKRVISGGSGVIYKGSGWYITDYKNGNGQKSATETAEKPAKKENKQAGNPEKTASAS